MNKIAFVGAKGGIGKTTSAMLTAAALAATDETVLVVDTDPQGSARTWAQYVSQQGGPPLPFDVHAGGTDFSLRIPKGPAWAIVDTPPANQALIRAAIKWADLVVLPTRPGVLDLLQLNPVLEEASSAGTPAAVLLTQTRAGVKETAETIKALEEAGTFMMTTQIPMRARTARLALVRPSVRDLEASGYQAVADELQGAFQ